MSVNPKPVRETPRAYSAQELLYSATIIHNEEIANFARSRVWHAYARKILSRVEMEAIGGLVFMQLRLICEEAKPS